MKNIFVLIISLGILQFANSQEYIKTVKVFSKKTDFEFTNEWQYVSTDLYLFNADRFNYLINHINPVKKKGVFNKKKKEDIKNIMVTAQLDGMGDLDALTYPIFNFVVTKNDDGDFQTQVTEPGAIRIVDNVPISSVNGHIGAKIQVAVYSEKNRPEIYKFIAAQLQTASNLSAVSTTDAALEVVGEIGKMMQNDAAGKQYQFESTIRFYEEQNFDRHLHSISIFVFQPSQYYSNGFDTTDIYNFFDTTKIASINKDKINQLINHNMFPYVIAVNYRSKYKPEISDEISFDMLKIRAAKNEANYKNKGISRDVYLQEKSLIDFLTVFAQFQLDVSNYELNYKAKITEDFTIQLFLILQDYWKLKNTYKTISKSFTGNQLFENEFKPLYNRYLTKANLKFEGNSALRSIREHVETIYDLETNGSDMLDSAKQENYIRKLRATNLPQREYNSDEATITRHWIGSLENNLYSKFFQPQIFELSGMPVLPETNEMVQKLLMKSSSSYCELCKVNMQSFANDFALEYDEYLYVESSKELNKLNNDTRTKIFEFSKRQNCIQSNIDSTSSGLVSEHIALIINTLDSVSKFRNELYVLVNEPNNYGTSKEIQTRISEIKSLSNEINATLNSICKANPELCDCEELQKNTENQTENNH